MTTTHDTDVSEKICLPSLKSVCKDLINEEETKPIGMTRHHYRARSVPTALPSNPPASAAAKRQNEESSMELLLNAIALDQKMTVVYKNERIKSFVREQQWLHKTHESAHFKPRSPLHDQRRRSNSAPGAPMSHYYQNIALNSTRWYLPNHGDLEPCHDSHDIARSLVQQHLKSAMSVLKK
jgi:hypothetical protein